MAAGGNAVEFRIDSSRFELVGLAGNQHNRGDGTDVIKCYTLLDFGGYT